MVNYQTIVGEKYLWQIAQVDQELAAQKAAQFNFSCAVMNVVLARGYQDSEHIKRFLFTPAQEIVGQPEELKDAQKAIDRIILALDKKEKILIAGDYDVDGITSSALIMACLLPLDAQVNFFLPHRIHDGYGLSVKTITRAAQSGYTVVITVDNGITAYEPARHAHMLGIDLIITDHHRPHEQLPQAYAVVNPHQDNCSYPFKKFAGVGVGFKLMQLLYDRLGKSLPDKVYELLLLGTVADVVPLVEENRYWVRYGLQHINKQLSKPIDVLRANAGVTKTQLGSTDIGFFITPQINALGRLEDPREGVKFLIGEDIQETERIGRVLGQLNETRKRIERTIFQDVVQLIESKTINIESEKIIIAVSSDWPAGVIGLVAGRLAATYMRPVILLHKSSAGILKGSCRSIPALNIFEALQDSKDLLTNFGGHAQAAGLSFPEQSLPELKKRLESYIASRLTDEDFKQKLIIESGITLAETNRQLVQELSYLEPFGCENPRPLFILQNVFLIERPQLLKEAHVKCMITSQGVTKPLIFFNRPELYERLNAQRNEPFHVVVSIIENEWQGRSSIELQGFDISYTDMVKI